MIALRRSSLYYPRIISLAKMSQLGELGSGAGKGGGGGGAIRSAGGAFGKMEAAREEEYFHKKQLQQLKDLKDDKITQQDFHEAKIKEHEDALNRHRENLKKVKDA